MVERAGTRRRGWARKLAWLVVIWCISVGSLAVVAYLLKLLMRASGLTL